MDLFDELLNKSPKEKFIEIIQHAGQGALERVLEGFFAEYIALAELAEAAGVSEREVKNFTIERGDFVAERLNDIYIELGAKILGHEG